MGPRPLGMPVNEGIRLDDLSPLSAFPVWDSVS